VIANIERYIDDAPEEEEIDLDCWVNPETGRAQSGRAIRKMDEMCESLGFIPVPRLANSGTFLRLLYDVLCSMVVMERPRDSNEPFGLAELMDKLKQGVLKIQQEKRDNFQVQELPSDNRKEWAKALIDHWKKRFLQTKDALKKDIEKLSESLTREQKLLDETATSLKDSTDTTLYWREKCYKESDEKKYWMDQYDKLLTSTSVTQSKFDAAKKCRADNGIEKNETDTVLQALCYILLDVETEQFMAS
jgi:hypothetical protein